VFKPVGASTLVVRAPAIYEPVSGPPCFALQKGFAACFRLKGSSRDTDVLTYAARQPPAYYAVVGTVSLMRRAGSGTVYLMRFLSALMTGAFVATAITALRRSAAPRLLAAGLVVAVTPMALFMSSVVNPGGPEIAASLALWVCGLVLVATSQTKVDNRLVTAVGIAGCVLALSRQLGPLWLALIALLIAGVANRDALRNLVRSSWARLWALLIAASCVAQVVWDAIVRPRDATLVDRSPSHLSTLEEVRDSLGATFRWYREMIGWFGWLDTPAPVLTWLLWTAAIAFFVFVALAWVNRRHVAVLLALLAAIVITPIVIESTPYRAPGTFWQGRDLLPLAVGVPILAAIALASTERGRRLVTPRLQLTVGVAVGVAHFLAFAQNLRRYTVGYDGEFQYWKDPQWSPPLQPLLLTIVFAIAVVVFVSYVLTCSGSPARPAREERERMTA
jgi:hypothetical protein